MFGSLHASRVLASASSRSTSKKVRFGEPPKPTRGTRALPGRRAHPLHPRNLSRRSLGEGGSAVRNFYFGVSDSASFWKRGSFRSGSNIGSSRSSARVSGTFCVASGPPYGSESTFRWRGRALLSAPPRPRGLRRHDNLNLTADSREQSRNDLGHMTYLSQFTALRW